MKNKRLGLLATPYGVWAVGFVIIPLFMILYYAFTSQDTGAFTFSNFSEVFTASSMKALGISLGLALISTGICLLLAYPLAMILAEMRVSRSSFVVMIFIVPMWMNFLLRTFAWQTLLEKNGVINTLLTAIHLPPLEIINTPAAIVLGMVYDFLPFMILPIYNVLAKLDRELIVAARDLGANGVQTFLRVTLPLSLPGIISGITMVFIPSLTTFVISDLLGGGKILLFGNMIEQQFKQLNNWNVGSAMSVILMIFIVITMIASAKNDNSGEGAIF